jgi:hypothetical protein
LKKAKHAEATNTFSEVGLLVTTEAVKAALTRIQSEKNEMTVKKREKKVFQNLSVTATPRTLLQVFRSK